VRTNDGNIGTTNWARILVVDDDDAVRSVLTESLSALGYDVIQAQNGKKALEILRKVPVDLAMIDFAMPEMNGAAVAVAASELREGLRLMFVSGYSDTSAIEAAVGSDVTLLKKPFTIDELQAAVEECLQ
jgi:DNA-binding NtrC family response regulator